MEPPTGNHREDAVDGRLRRVAEAASEEDVSAALAALAACLAEAEDATSLSAALAAVTAVAGRRPSDALPAAQTTALAEAVLSRATSMASGDGPQSIPPGDPWPDPPLSPLRGGRVLSASQGSALVNALAASTALGDALAQPLVRSFLRDAPASLRRRLRCAVRGLHGGGMRGELAAEILRASAGPDDLAREAARLERYRRDVDLFTRSAWHLQAEILKAAEAGDEAAAAARREHLGEVHARLDALRAKREEAFEECGRLRREAERAAADPRPAMAEALALLTDQGDVAWWRAALDAAGPGGCAIREDGVRLAPDFCEIAAQWRDGAGGGDKALGRALDAGLLPHCRERAWWTSGSRPWDDEEWANVSASPWHPSGVAALACLGHDAVRRAEELALFAAGAAAETTDERDTFQVVWRLVNPCGLRGLLTFREAVRADDTEREPDEDAAEDELARLGLPVLRVSDGDCIVLALPAAARGALNGPARRALHRGGPMQDENTHEGSPPGSLFPKLAEALSLLTYRTLTHWQLVLREGRGVTLGTAWAWSEVSGREAWRYIAGADAVREVTEAGLLPPPPEGAERRWTSRPPASANEPSTVWEVAVVASLGPDIVRRAEALAADVGRVESGPGGAAKVTWYVDSPMEVRHIARMGLPQRGWPAYRGVLDAIDRLSLMGTSVVWAAGGEVVLAVSSPDDYRREGA